MIEILCIEDSFTTTKTNRSIVGTVGSMLSMDSTIIVILNLVPLAYKVRLYVQIQ